MSTSEQKAGNTNSITQKVPEKKIQLRKKTAKELEEMATARSSRALSAESLDENEPIAPTACPSETSMQKLNSDLKKVPMVKAFNSAEQHLEKK